MKKLEPTRPPALLIDPIEAARLLCVSDRTLRTWTKAGEVAFVQLGRLVRYTLDDLQRFIASKKIDSGTLKLLDLSY